MEISYKRTHRESYMVVETENVPENYQEQMLKENEIRVLLSFHTIQLDGKTQFWHDISGKQSLRDYMDYEGISLLLLEKIFTGMALAFRELQKYLIQQRSIILRSDMVYISRQDQFRMFFCFCPVLHQDDKPMFCELMEYIVEKVNREEESLAQLCYQLYELSLRRETTLQEMHAVVEREIQSRMETSVVEEDNDKICVEETLSVTEQISGEEEDIYYVSSWERVLQQVRQRGQRLLAIITGWGKETANDVKREDFIIEPEPEISKPTQLLYQGQRPCQGQLLYQGTKQEKDYTITKATICIGHGEGENDVSLASDAVSHFHARITKQGTDYYIEDMNSTNGTYVNGEPLCYTERHKLQVMDRIQFADVSYLFL